MNKFLYVPFSRFVSLYDGHGKSLPHGRSFVVLQGLLCDPFENAQDTLKCAGHTQVAPPVVFPGVGLRGRRLRLEENKTSGFRFQFRTVPVKETRGGEPKVHWQKRGAGVPAGRHGQRQVDRREIFLWSVRLNPGLECGGKLSREISGIGLFQCKTPNPEAV